MTNVIKGEIAVLLGLLVTIAANVVDRLDDAGFRWTSLLPLALGITLRFLTRWRWEHDVANGESESSD